MTQDQYDIVVVGGGLVGASFAVAVQPCGLKTLVVESFEPESTDQPSYDERTVALTHSAKLIFSGMGIWQSIATTQAEPIKDIHISNKGYFGMTHLHHNDVGTEALGYVVPTRVIGRVLWGRLRNHSGTETACPADVLSIESHEDHHEIEIQQQDQMRRIKTQMVVVADGGRSPISDSFRQNETVSEYQQTAILSIVSTDRDHHGRAYERFTVEGPLALLPCAKKRYAVVWTTSPDHLDSRLSLSDEGFIEQLQQTFGDRAGNFSRPSQRNHYPLRRGHLDHPASDRTVIIGNAAHTVHPVAGQGFNLGLRDVSTLAEIIFDNPQLPLGSAQMLDEYTRKRKRDTKMVSGFTHSLIEIFSNDLVSLGLMRNLGLKGIEMFPPAKRFLLKRTMGMTGHPSRLAMGLPLDS